ncbi:PIG-L family deacetylase [Kribbella sp. NPDC056861]|uniref:PIG-L deacetylase family protein n=1 Tax=Kribbella sp. NPDC056861 TaxID=3154857 RepID=UPI003439A808
MRYVGVFAHQDDEMNCLGTLLRLREGGHEVSFVTVTDGGKGLPYDPAATRQDAAAVRAAEMRTVAEAFAGEHVCLGREDGFVIEDADLRRELIAVLRTLRADVVFTHWTDDYNPDHVLTAKLVADAALFTSLASFCPAGPEPLAGVPRIWHVDPGPGHGFEATHFVELGNNHVTAKAELIRLHRSQMDVMRTLGGTDYADLVAAANRLTGQRLLVSAAEAFRPCLSERRIPWPSDLPGRLS